MLDDGSISGVTSLPTDNSNLPSGTAVNWDSQLPSIVTLHPDEKITHQTDMDFNPPLSLIATSVNPEASEDLTDHQLKLADVLALLLGRYHFLQSLDDSMHSNKRGYLLRN